MARAKQSKYIVLSNLCEICVAPTKFELVGDAVGQEEGKRWAKCAKCHHTMMIDMMVIEGERRAARETNVSVEDCIPYSPKRVYTIGDSIYHKTWDDVGIIRSKEIMSNGRAALLVHFEKNKEKRLVENLV